MNEDFEYLQMLAGELYYAPDLHPGNTTLESKKKCQQINKHPIENRKEIIALEKQLFGKTGNVFYIHPPFQVEFGRHIEVGENFYANMDCIFMDVNTITFGDNILIGPRVCFYTAGHPIDAEVRNEELEFALPITVGNNVWVGGNSIILPGVEIGDNVVVAAGSVVSKNVPNNTVVGGNPAKIIRQINKDDARKWQEKMTSYLEKKEAFNQFK